jgi:hypothetical protein
VSTSRIGEVRTIAAQGCPSAFSLHPARGPKCCAPPSKENRDMVKHPASPDAGNDIVPIVQPVYIEGGLIQGMAIALTRAGSAMYYLVVPTTKDSAPLWVSESHVDVARFGPPPDD